MIHFISSMNQNNREVHDTVEYCKRFQQARIRLLLGFEHEQREFNPNRDIRHICPNSKVVRKFSKATGKVENVIVPCGHCLYCRHNNQNQLVFRMYQHNKAYNNSAFVTLTYDESHYTQEPIVLRDDITKFLKRFRKSLNDNTFSYYMVCERGDLRNRCHFHLILWWNGIASQALVQQLVIRSWYSRSRTDLTFSEYSDLLSTSYGVPISQMGIVYYEPNINTNIASYVSKYVSGTEKKLVFRSWSLGLGRSILEDNPTLVAQLMYLNIIKYSPNENTYSICVPRYYKRLVFSQAERDIMFMDYLASPDYKRQLKILEDPVIMHNILKVYEAYEERAINAYKAKCKEKARKKRLL